jgi:protein-disulfide isomerase
VLDRYPDTVKFVVKHFPLSSHKFARKAATAALAANNQGKFWEFHHKLFENYRALNDAKIEEIAKELELDMDKFATDMKSPGVVGMINRDVRDGRQIGVRGTPTVYVNGKLLRNRNIQGFMEMIDAELKKGS